MYIEAVIVCENYSDFLEHTLYENLQHLDRVVVVTSHEDARTRGLCNKFSVECVVTDVMHKEGDKFNKALAINLGLGHLTGKDWILHLDADVVLPHRFRDLLRRANLQKEYLYGCDRINLRSFEDWIKVRDERSPHYLHSYFVIPNKLYEMGARIVHMEHGYVPIGYFQLWHSSQGKRYPLAQGNAEHTDLLFACQWARQHRVLLPEVLVYHLESEESEMGTNWNGRKTKHFGPSHSIVPKKPYRSQGDK